MESRVATYIRAELYDQVWTEPVSTVARRYGVSDVALAKACRRLAVPLPGRGYWARKAAGQDPPRQPLRALPAGVRDGVRVRRVERASPIRGIVPIPVAATLVDPHPLVASTVKHLERAKPVEGLVSRRAPRCLNVSVSPANLNRALRILDALVKALEAHGHRVRIEAAPERNQYGHRVGWGHGLPEHDTRVLIGDVWISFALAESTEAGPAAEPSPGGWPRYTPRIPTGRLALRILNVEWPAGRHRWQDGVRQRVEDCLGAFVAQLHARAAAISKGRAEEAAQQERWREAERQRAEEERFRREDEQRAKELVAVLDRWRLARDIRQYTTEARALVADAELIIVAGSVLDRHLAWADRYAEDIDPLSGVRESVEAALGGRHAPSEGTVGASPDQSRDS